MNRRNQVHPRFANPRSFWAAVLLPAALLICACTPASEGREGASAPDSVPSSPTPPAETERTAPLVDPTIPFAVVGQAGWEYHQEASINLDGDEAPERLVVLANASMRNGKPLWDDAHIWQVYVEEPGGERTYIFSRRVQLGPLDLRLTRTDGTRPPSLLIVERGPYLLGLHEIRYRGPAALDIVQGMQWETDPSPWNRAPEA